MAVKYADIYRESNFSFFLIVSLLLTWVIGILLGYFYYEPSFSPMMRSVVIRPVSIVGLFSCIFLPLFCSFFSVIVRRPIFILIVCFFKAVSFGFSCGMLTQLYGSAAWLIRFLFLFSDSCFCVILLLLWSHRFVYPNIRGYRDFFYCALFGAGIALVDSLFISPFLQGLF